MATQGIWVCFKSIFEHMKNNSSFPGYGYCSKKKNLNKDFNICNFSFVGCNDRCRNKTIMHQEHDPPGFKFTKLPFPLQEGTWKK